MKGIVIVLLVCCCLRLQAQTAEEIFNQKKTQRKYLLEAIASLQLYSSYAAKGYAVVQKGVQVVGEIKRGDLSMHSLFFDRLNVVSPAVRNSGKVAAVIAMQVQTVKGINAVRSQYTGMHRQYVRSVLDHLAESSNAMLDELMQIVSDHPTKMNDAEQFQKIDLLYEEARSQNQFLQSLAADVYQMKKKE